MEPDFLKPQMQQYKFEAQDPNVDHQIDPEEYEMIAIEITDDQLEKLYEIANAMEAQTIHEALSYAIDQAHLDFTGSEEDFFSEWNEDPDCEDCDYPQPGECYLSFEADDCDIDFEKE